MTALHNSSTDVSTALSSLIRAITRARDAILLPGAVLQGVIYDQYDGSQSSDEPDILLANAISEVNVGDDSANGSVLRYPGCFEVSAKVLEMVKLLNAAKQDFEDCVKGVERGAVKPHQMRSLYRQLGHGRIHPLQAWRQINILDTWRIDSIGFTIAKATDGIEILGYEAALARLQAANAVDVIAQLEQLPPYQKLHWHTPVAQHVRANIVWEQDGERQTRMLGASLPFLVPEGAWPEKRVRFNQPRKHAKRSDIKGTTIINLPFRAGSYLSVA